MEQRNVLVHINQETIQLESDATLLEADSHIQFGCRAGACGSCLIKVKEGKNNLNEMQDSEKALLEMIEMNPNEYRLACQCRVNGDITIETCNQ